MLEFHFWSGKNLPKLDLKLNKKVVVYTENRLKIDHHSFHEKGNPYHFIHSLPIFNHNWIRIVCDPGAISFP